LGIFFRVTYFRVLHVCIKIIYIKIDDSRELIKPTETEIHINMWAIICEREDRLNTVKKREQ